MKQKQYAPLTVGDMAISLFAADRGYLDDVEVSKIVDFEAALHAYVRSNHGALMEQINTSGDYSDEIEAGMKKAVEDFKANGAY